MCIYSAIQIVTYVLHIVYSKSHFVWTCVTSLLVFGLFLTKYTINYTIKIMNMASTRKNNVFSVIIIFIVIKARNSTANRKYKLYRLYTNVNYTKY